MAWKHRIDRRPIITITRPTPPVIALTAVQLMGFGVFFADGAGRPPTVFTLFSVPC